LIGTERQSSQDVDGAVLRRRNDYRQLNRASAFANAFEDFVSIDPRHHDIEEDGIVRVLEGLPIQGEGTQSGFAIRDRFDAEADFLQFRSRHEEVDL
jgi:hypothetical protein